MKVQNYTPEAARQLMADWIDALVVGLNLCPFAAPVVRDQSLRIAVSEAKDPQALVADFLYQLEELQQQDEVSLSTSVLAVPYMLADFDDYLDMLALLEELLERAGVEGIFQLASFHPAYCFDGVPADDISHWTNRSPFPAFHLIREAQISRVLEHYKDPEGIPERNIARLQKLGKAGLIERFPPLADYWPETPE